MPFPNLSPGSSLPIPNPNGRISTTSPVAARSEKREPSEREEKAKTPLTREQCPDPHRALTSPASKGAPSVRRSARGPTAAADSDPSFTSARRCDNNPHAATPPPRPVAFRGARCPLRAGVARAQRSAAAGTRCVVRALVVLRRGGCSCRWPVRGPGRDLGPPVGPVRGGAGAGAVWRPGRGVSGLGGWPGPRSSTSSTSTTSLSVVALLSLQRTFSCRERARQCLGCVSRVLG
jgi:hypothetical protein